MLKTAAMDFGAACSGLNDFKRMCWGLLNAKQLSTIPAGKAEEVNSLLRTTAKEAVMGTRRACILADLDVIRPELDRFDEALNGPLDIADWQQRANHLLDRLADHLQSEFYFQVDQRDVPLYQGAAIFGERVADKFPLAAEDIGEAAKCLALQRPTACVFHLMRAMEVVVQRLGKRLGVKNIDKEWGKILSDIHNAIGAMPKTTKAEQRKRNAWSEAHANLYHVKQAWRNDTMHPKQTYTREEAQEVFNTTRVFMAHLAGLI